MKLKLTALCLITILASCKNQEPANIDGHWHFIEDSYLYKTIDLAGNKGIMNKYTSYDFSNDLEINLTSKSIKQSGLGFRDSLLHYKIEKDTLFIKSIRFGNEFKALRVANCTPVKDWLIDSPLEFEISKTNILFGDNLKPRSLAVNLVVNEIGGEVKYSYADTISTSPKILKEIHSGIIQKIAKRDRDKVHLDLYVDGRLQINRIEWLVKAIPEAGFLNTNLIFEVKKGDEFIYRSLELKKDFNSDLTVQEYIDEMATLHGEN